jgi:hypothetical protein
MRVLLGLVALSLVPSAALAHPGRHPHAHPHRKVVVAEKAPPRDEGGDAAVTVLLGTDTAFDANPASLRLTLSGETDIVRDKDVALAIALPFTIMTAGNSFNGGVNQTAFEIPPSLRLRLLPHSIVRPYGDLGLGVVFVSENGSGGGLFESHDQTAGLMTRGALGLEIGDPDGLMFVVEPISARSYHIGPTYGRFGVMIGGGARF